jgi:hypothetical protein
MQCNTVLRPFRSVVLFQINVKCDRLLFFFLLGVVLLLSRLGLLSSDTTWTSSTEWRGKGEVDVLLGVETDDEGWDVDNLLSDTTLFVRVCPLQSF